MSKDSNTSHHGHFVFNPPSCPSNDPPKICISYLAFGIFVAIAIYQQDVLEQDVEVVQEQ